MSPFLFPFLYTNAEGDGENVCARISQVDHVLQNAWGFDAFAFPVSNRLSWCRDVTKDRVIRQSRSKHRRALVDGELDDFVFDHEESGTSIFHRCT